jgi:Zn-dependent protease with chaperone function
MTPSSATAVAGPYDNRRRGAAVVAAGALPPAVVLGLIALIGGWPAAVIVFVVVVAALTGWIWATAGPRAEAAVGGTPAEPGLHPRLFNLVEGLGAAVGVPPPRLRVVESASLNAVAVGKDPASATLAVTSGLLSSLSRIELEAVLAEEMIRIKRWDTRPATLAVAAGPLGRMVLHACSGDAQDDLQAVSLTRYPPGLAAALETMAGVGTAIPGSHPALAGLWLADPGAGQGGARRLPLSERIQALREL